MLNDIFRIADRSRTLLKVNARVPNIIRRHNWDDREVSLITKAQFDERAENQPVLIFDSRNTSAATHWYVKIS